jgi:hypothetical protein
MASLLTAALAYHAAGASIIPCATDATKRPLVSEWKDFQITAASQQQVENWFSRNDRFIGVISGAVSGGREGIDIDNKPSGLYPDAEDLLNQLANMVDQDIPDLWDRLAIEASPSNGAHIVYRCTIIEGNQKLAMRPATQEDKDAADNQKLDRVTLIETRGEGGYLISAPSPGYRVIQGDLINPPLINPQERAVLFRAARALNLLHEDTRVIETPLAVSETGERPGDDYNARTSAPDVVAMLEGEGWAVCVRRRDGVILMRRPGKRFGWSATVGYGNTNLLRVFSSNAAPFEMDRSYPPFSVYSLLKHDGNWAEAARQLGLEGFGTPKGVVFTGEMIADVPIPPDVKTTGPSIPLPDYARLDPKLETDASPWLNAYIEHSRYWSPRSFEGFHEAVGLWLLSTVAARRVVVHFGKPQYTPLLIALAGRSTIHAKTTAAEIGIEVLTAAGLDWLLADDSATPQKFVRDRTQAPPDNFDKLSGKDLALAEMRLMFAGQCGWWYDEFGMLLHAMARSGGAMADFSGLLRKFDDCAPKYVYGTIGRPTDKIIAPYLALMASLTPADLKPLMRKGSAGWSDGFWARWIFVTPPSNEYRNDRFPGGKRTPPPGLVQTLTHWHERLGKPTYYVHDKEPQIGPLPVTVCHMSPDAHEAYYRYNQALLDLMATGGMEDLDAWHGRLATKALRAAALLASLENDNEIELPHWARAQAMAERWRESAYRLYQQTNTQDVTDKKNAEDAVMKVVERLVSPSVREIGQRIKWLSAGEIQEQLEKLLRAGMVEAVKTTQTIRYRLPILGKGVDVEDVET